MSDSEEFDLGEGEAPGSDSPAKKSSGLAALLPNLLKFVAIGLGALIFIVTVAVITFNVLNKGGKSQTAIPESSPYIGTRPQYSYSTIIGPIRTRTKDDSPYAVVVDMVIGYNLNDNAAQTELTGRLYQLRDFVRSFFSSKYAVELQPENEARLKQEILEYLNNRVLDTAKARIILFNQLDVMEM
ncbi:MAG: flagellar basal body-associated FliL family protein [Treponema sp.]|nr:flagellar basal body-associated FliL family protein [Treponema sp.]